MNSRSTPVRALLVGGLALVTSLTALVASGPATQASVSAAKPPVSTLPMADPGVVLTGGDFIAYTTGTKAPAFQGDIASGPWVAKGSVLASLGSWASSGAIWAPDAVQVSGSTWVLFYSAKVAGLVDDGQRCIGAATSTSGPLGPFQPDTQPLSCTAGAQSPGGAALNPSDLASTPNNARVGLIDPAPFQADNGKRYVLYKTQKLPASLRIVPVDSTWTNATGPSVELRQDNTYTIEAPEMVQRGSEYVLFASKYAYDKCKYSTVWYRSGSPTSGFANATEHDLMTQASTGGVCGPGGADITPAQDGGTRVFFHGWVCNAANTTPCTSTGQVPATAERVLYVGVVGWGADGATPAVTKFLGPGE